MSSRSPLHVHIIGDGEALLWGLSGRERLRRIVARIPHAVLTERLDGLPAGAPVLLLRGDTLFDERVVHALAVSGAERVLVPTRGAPAVAARIAGARAEAALSALSEGRFLTELREVTPSELVSGADPRQLSLTPPRVLPITAGNRAGLEAELFAGAYKGVTDLVTKWLWPKPAQWATRLCVKLGLRPNHVTALSLILTVAAFWAFLEGRFGLGLVAGWFMTLLDTVDGKLARVTVTSSRFGDIFDHGIDLIHPPLWYLAWGLALAESWEIDPDLEIAVWIVFLGYIGGRLCENAFRRWAAQFSLFIWRPFDSYLRLVLARRNTSLILLTAAWIADEPDVGLVAVAGWHLLSAIVMAGRVLQAVWIRKRTGPLTAWLDEVDQIRDRHRLAVRIFTRAPAHGAAPAA